MDIINDTYGQHRSFANVDEKPNLLFDNLAFTTNIRFSTPSQNTIMKDVLSELENKDYKINILETKIDDLIKTLNSLVFKTNDQ